MYCNNEGYADYLPVDIAVNGILIGTWNYIDNEYVDRFLSIKFRLRSGPLRRLKWKLGEGVEEVELLRRLYN